MKSILFCFVFILFFESLFAQTYTQGAYYTHEGQRIEGLIQHNYFARFSDGPDNYINFKETSDSKKKKLTTKEVKSFVIGSDSFVIIKHFTINSFAYYEEDFVKIIKTGNLNLYLHYSTGGSGNTFFLVSNYILEKDAKLVVMRKRSFKDNYKNLFGDDVDLVKKIEDKSLTYKDLDVIVDEYNNWYIESNKNTSPND
jgi:uncharacterized beta-barrel protein YwiB (DUF1934 family)